MQKYNNNKKNKKRKEEKRKSKGICTHSGVSEQFAKAETDEGKQRAEIQKKVEEEKKKQSC